MKITQDEVFEKVKIERRYQDSFITGVKYENTIHTVGEEILMIQDYTTKAISEWTNKKGDEAALHVVRKIAALAIRCLEHHGCPDRMLF